MIFAFYRRPYENEYTAIIQTTDEVKSVFSYEDLDGQTGFVFAPFYISDKHPMILIKPDIVESREINQKVDFTESVFEEGNVVEERAKYAKVFSCFHENIINGRFSKIVLSRCSDEVSKEPLDAEKLFMRACVAYPRMFIALVSTPVSGTWLMATPEILMESVGGRWHTMALAGTKNIEDVDSDEALRVRKLCGDIREWDSKNIKEQQFVAQYIGQRLNQFAVNVDVVGPYSLRAGKVKHLASDFMFDLKEHNSIGGLIGQLHPTPAVCGIPKDETYDFIRQNELYDRAYYSGFAGPLLSEENTHLYVILRCMSINGRHFKLYAGGGLVGESDEHHEWLETEAKMDTMRRCLAIKRI